MYKLIATTNETHKKYINKIVEIDVGETWVRLICEQIVLCITKLIYDRTGDEIRAINTITGVYVFHKEEGKESLKPEQTTSKTKDNVPKVNIKPLSPLTKLYYNAILDLLRPTPTKVIHNNNHTIILFDDGSKTVTKPNGDKYDPYIGFCVAMTAKYFGGKKAAHQAYETLSGCKYGKQPEQVAGLAEKIARATENMNKLAEAFREANTRKQTEQKAESLPFFGNVENLTAGDIDTTAINAEPKANPLPILQTSNEKVLAVDETCNDFLCMNCVQYSDIDENGIQYQSHFCRDKHKDCKGSIIQKVFPDTKCRYFIERI